MKKKLVILIALALILAIAGSVAYVLTNIDSMVKSAIEKYGSQALKTPDHVSSVKIKLSDGEGAVHGLTVADPPGFDSPSIITLGDIAIRIAVKTITSTPIVIENVLISGPDVFYEMKENGSSNLDVLKKNLTPSGPVQEQQQKGQKKKEIRLHIRKLVFEKGKVQVYVAKLMDKPSVIDLPRLELIDIGKHNGATPAEIARTLATALAEEAAKSIAKAQGERLLRKGSEELLKKYLSQ